MRAPALGGYLLPQRQSSQREPGHVSKRAAGLDVWAPHLLGVPAKERGNATSRVTPNGSNSSRLHTQLRRRSGVGESQRPSVQRHSTAANNVLHRRSSSLFARGGAAGRPGVPALPQNCLGAEPPVRWFAPVVPKDENATSARKCHSPSEGNNTPSVPIATKAPKGIGNRDQEVNRDLSRKRTHVNPNSLSSL